jgi:hypothetical protein
MEGLAATIRLLVGCCENHGRHGAQLNESLGPSTRPKTEVLRSRISPNVLFCYAH